MVIFVIFGGCDGWLQVWQHSRPRHLCAIIYTKRSIASYWMLLDFICVLPVDVAGDLVGSSTFVAVVSCWE